jgi:hypothetical protein
MMASVLLPMMTPGHQPQELPAVTFADRHAEVDEVFASLGLPKLNRIAGDGAAGAE